MSALESFQRVSASQGLSGVPASTDSELREAGPLSFSGSDDTTTTWLKYVRAYVAYPYTFKQATFKPPKPVASDDRAYHAWGSTDDGTWVKEQGSWKIARLPFEQKSSLTYELTVQGCFGMPVSLIEQRLRDDLTANLIAVEQEALKRSECSFSKPS